MLLLVFSLVIAGALGKSVPQQCLSRNGKMYNLLSTVTPYDDVRGKISQFKGCKAKRLWGFVRHATRYPHDYQINRYSNLTLLRDQILQNHAKNRGSLCASDLELFRGWHLVADPNQNMLLTISGIEELRKFGKRLGKAFPDLLKDPSKVDIKITSKERTRQSAEAFVTGLYGSHLKIDNSKVHDDLLKNEKNCPAWKKSTKNAKLQEEMGEFRNSTEMREVIENVSRRLGFERKLEYGQLKDIYDVCGFEYSFYHNPEILPWCSVFSERDLKIMEFSEDVSYYYKSAFGNEYSPKLGCSLVRDMVDKLSGHYPKASLYFGHSMGNRKLLTSLRIGEDNPLSGDAFATSSDRKWRTSYLTPFAANLLAIRYECKKDSRVAVFVNERLAHLPACGGLESCSLEQFIRGVESLTAPSYCNRDFCGPLTRRLYDSLEDYYGDDDDDN